MPYPISEAFVGEAGLAETSIPAVIIPAHNEEQSITALLRALSPGMQASLYTVTVACNGCTDRTAAIVRYHFPEVRCIELSQASKVAALNAAERQGAMDAAAGDRDGGARESENEKESGGWQAGYPRIYIDADVVINTSAVVSLIAACRQASQPVVVAPRAVPITDGCAWIVRAYYRAWQKTVFFQQQGFGSGVYGLNRAARDKFDRFPNLISDDGFVRQRLAYQNILVVESAKSLVQSPRDLAGLIRIKTRSKLGCLEMNPRFPLPAAPASPAASASAISPLSASATSEGATASRRFVEPPTLTEWLVYGAINLLALVNAHRLLRRHGSARWLRDDSSRRST
ncbi:hypothetical protein Maes01_02109 [Microbulbifer aestuariivivens]|uniref:Glycosyltransferase 2-like domain-containing protein n=1 Tax=Microbulbifer aestuariivivens TaxID=1908308 RepID=A0ABP9WR05_9GAMM